MTERSPVCLPVILIAWDFYNIDFPSSKDGKDFKRIQRTNIYLTLTERPYRQAHVKQVAD